MQSPRPARTDPNPIPPADDPDRDASQNRRLSFLLPEFLNRCQSGPAKADVSGFGYLLKLDDSFGCSALTGQNRSKAELGGSEVRVHSQSL